MLLVLFILFEMQTLLIFNKSEPIIATLRAVHTANNFLFGKASGETAAFRYALILSVIVHFAFVVIFSVSSGKVLRFHIYMSDCGVCFVLFVFFN